MRHIDTEKQGARCERSRDNDPARQQQWELHSNFRRIAETQQPNEPLIRGVEVKPSEVQECCAESLLILEMVGDVLRCQHIRENDAYDAKHTRRPVVTPDVSRVARLPVCDVGIQRVSSLLRLL